MKAPKAISSKKLIIIVGLGFVVLLGVVFMVFQPAPSQLSPPSLGGQIKGVGVLSAELAKVKLETRKARIQMEEIQASLDVPSTVAERNDYASLSPEDQKRYKKYFDAREEYETAILVEQTIARRIGEEVSHFPAAKKE